MPLTNRKYLLLSQTKYNFIYLFIFINKVKNSMKSQYFIPFHLMHEKYR